ncbi:MAG: chemotaxis-specific protein-glutamate methyltransferase CheB [Rhodospirillaceae bacterium]|nr:chemotaxis-specific protein-glutamate methyltransferase CheB [Rhodospirillales bacterium]
MFPQKVTEKIKVLIVEDSPVVQRLLEHVINDDPRLHVVGVAADAAEAMRMIRHLAPDIVTMDIRLPRMNGFEATRWIMRDHPVPIVVVASNVDDKALDISMNALRAGALSVVAKPSGLSHDDYQAMANHLCTQLFIMSQIKVVRQRAAPKIRPFIPTPPEPLCAVELVAVVASTGGPGALSRILGSLPKDFPVPVTLVQHFGAPFIAGFAHWLGSVSALPVSLARDHDRLIQGHVHIAPGEAHLTVAEGYLRLDRGAAVQGQRPSGDVLFDSVAASYGNRAVGVLLTGMGEDGARGLEALHRTGAHTIAESKSTAVIWGMPGAAVARGAVTEELPLDCIALRLRQLTAPLTSQQAMS